MLVRSVAVTVSGIALGSGGRTCWSIVSLISSVNRT